MKRIEPCGLAVRQNISLEKMNFLGIKPLPNVAFFWFRNFSSIVSSYSSEEFISISLLLKNYRGIIGTLRSRNIAFCPELLQSINSISKE